MIICARGEKEEETIRHVVIVGFPLSRKVTERGRKDEDEERRVREEAQLAQRKSSASFQKGKPPCTHTHTHIGVSSHKLGKTSAIDRNKDQTHKDETRGYHCTKSGKKIIKSNRYSGQWQLWRFWLLQKDGGRFLCCCFSYFLYYSLETFLQSKRLIYQSL